MKLEEYGTQTTLQKLSRWLITHKNGYQLSKWFTQGFRKQLRQFT